MEKDPVFTNPVVLKHSFFPAERNSGSSSLYYCTCVDSSRNDPCKTTGKPSIQSNIQQIQLNNTQTCLNNRFVPLALRR